jgi:hypothetical protein
MITLCITPVMTGTIKEKIQISIICVLLDSLYILPILL